MTRAFLLTKTYMDAGDPPMMRQASRSGSVRVYGQQSWIHAACYKTIQSRSDVIGGTTRLLKTEESPDEQYKAQP
jgi:hypothetical protein